MRYTVEIPNWHPPTINELMRGKIRRRVKLGQSARNMIAVHFLLAGFPPAEGKRRVKLRITLGPRQRGADVDAYHKALLDGLKDCRAIKDDSRYWCEIAPVEFTKARVKATTIILEDMEP